MNAQTSAERSKAYRKRKIEEVGVAKKASAATPATPTERKRSSRIRLCSTSNTTANVQVEHIPREIRVENVVDENDVHTMDGEVDVSPFGTVVTNLIDTAKENSPVLGRFYEHITSKFFNDNLQDYCRVCDRIWWSSQLRDLTSIKKECVTEILIRAGYDVENPQFRICVTCLACLNKNHMTAMATVNGFVYPPVPLNLPSLSPLEIRLVALRIPFMQIRHIRYSPGAMRIIGQVINIPMNVEKTLKTLPRQLDDDATFNVCLKRHLAHRSSEFSGCISKRNIKTWIRYLIDTPLYRLNGVTVSESFMNNTSDTDDEEMEETVGDDDLSTRYYEQRAKEQQRREAALRNNFVSVTKRDERMRNGEEYLAMYQETLFWSEDLVIHLAPTMHERPLSLAFDEYAEELSFPAL